MAAGLAEILAENERLRQESAELQTALAEERAKREAVQRRADQLERMIALAELKRKGPASKRYVSDGQQAFAFPGEVVAPPRRAEPEPDEATGPPRTVGKTRGTPKRKPKRRSLADDTTLPRQTIRCPVEDDQACANCGQPLKVIGQAESARVDWVPGHFVIHDVVRDKCACPNCPDQGVLTVPAPYALPRALCGNGLLARILVDKFADHLPLNRQARRMSCEGFEIGTNTMSGWVGTTAGLLGHVVGAIGADVASAPALLADDTGHPVQDGSDGALRKGRFWVYTDQQQAIYKFSPTKAGEHPVAHLEGFEGKLLLVDGGSEFNAVERAYELERGGCWSHLRTYFHDARHHHPAEVDLAMGTIGDLFMLEREFAGRPAEEVRALRDAQSKPLVDGFFDWCRAMTTRTRPESTLGEAFTYALNQEARLRKFLEHGELPLHNNLAEFLLRQPVVGRKNWLFSGSEGGAEGAAILFSLIGSCHLQGIDPHTYLVDILGRLDSDPPERLTPKAWRRARDAVNHTSP